MAKKVRIRSKKKLKMRQKAFRKLKQLGIVKLLNELSLTETKEVVKELVSTAKDMKNDFIDTIKQDRNEPVVNKINEEYKPNNQVLERFHSYDGTVTEQEINYNELKNMRTTEPKTWNIETNEKVNVPKKTKVKYMDLPSNRFPNWAIAENGMIKPEYINKSPNELLKTFTSMKGLISKFLTLPLPKHGTEIVQSFFEKDRFVLGKMLPEYLKSDLERAGIEADDYLKEVFKAKDGSLQPQPETIQTANQTFDNSNNSTPANDEMNVDFMSGEYQTSEGNSYNPNDVLIQPYQLPDSYYDFNNVTSNQSVENVQPQSDVIIEQPTTESVTEPVTETIVPVEEQTLVIDNNVAENINSTNNELIEDNPQSAMVTSIENEILQNQNEIAHLENELQQLENSRATLTQEQYEQEKSRIEYYLAKEQNKLNENIDKKNSEDQLQQLPLEAQMSIANQFPTSDVFANDPRVQAYSNITYEKEALQQLDQYGIPTDQYSMNLRNEEIARRNEIINQNEQIIASYDEGGRTI